jgi:hypothetical protein
VSLKKSSLASLALLMSAVLASAQTPKGSWENLKQLQPGHKIKVVDIDLKSWDGKLVRVSDEAIAIREKQKQQEVTIERAKVLRVTDVQRSPKCINSLIGFGVGAGIAALASRGEDSRDRQVGIGLFGIIGAGTGAAVLHPRPTIYRRSEKVSISTTKPD